MFEKSDLVAADDSCIGGDDAADNILSSGTSSRRLTRQDSALTAMMDDQPDEDYWSAIALVVTSNFKLSLSTCALL